MTELPKKIIVNRIPYSVCNSNDPYSYEADPGVQEIRVTQEAAPARKRQYFMWEVKTTTVYNCDYCQKQLPDDYATTNGEGKGYYVKKAHDTIPLDTPIAGCTGIVVEVTLGTPKDDHHFTDLCDDCRLKFLKMAVEHLERKVAAEKEGLNNDGEETDV